jgi:hypothetical protein
LVEAAFFKKLLRTRLGSTLAEAHLDLETAIDLVKIDRGKDHFDLLDKFFLNSAYLSASACGLTERGRYPTGTTETRRLTPLRLRPAMPQIQE